MQSNIPFLSNKHNVEKILVMVMIIETLFCNILTLLRVSNPKA